LLLLTLLPAIYATAALISGFIKVISSAKVCLAPHVHAHVVVVVAVVLAAAVAAAVAVAVAAVAAVAAAAAAVMLAFG